MTDDSTNTTHPGIGVTAIRLVDGTLIDPLTRRPIGEQDRAQVSAPTPTFTDTPPQEVSDDVAAIPLAESPPPVDEIKPLTRRSIHDIKLSPQQMAVVNNVLVYTLWGLPDDEIAIQCSCTIDDVTFIRDLPEYITMHDALLAGLRAAYTGSTHGKLAAASSHAADVVIGALRSKSAQVALSAAKDVLDRSGHRPVDGTNININLGEGTDDLIIRVVRESDRPTLPTIELNGRSHAS